MTEHKTPASCASADLLLELASELRGVAREACVFASELVTAGRPIPDDVRGIIVRALSFTQDRFGK